MTKVMYIVEFSYEGGDYNTITDAVTDFVFESEDDAKAYMQLNGLFTYDELLEAAKEKGDEEFERVKKIFDEQFDAYSKAIHLGVDSEVLKRPKAPSGPWYEPVKNYHSISTIEVWERPDA